MRKILIAVALLLNCLSIALGTGRAFAAPDTEAIGQALFYLVNTERVAYGLPPLASNALLKKAATDKALDMMAQGYFEHNSPSGKIFHEWIDESGYKYTIAGENLAANMNTISPEKMVEYWMNSPLHKTNIVSPEYSETGLSVVSGVFQGKEAVFAVQTFAHPVDEMATSEIPEKIVTSTSSKPILKSPKTNSPASTTLHVIAIKSGEEPELAGIIAGASTVATSSLPETEFQPKEEIKKSFFEKLLVFFDNLIQRISVG